jgi:hypothetical protein
MLSYFMTIWIILLPFGNIYLHMAVWYSLYLFGIFLPFWYEGPRKIWQPCFLHAGFLPRLLSVMPFCRVMMASCMLPT